MLLYYQTFLIWLLKPLFQCTCDDESCTLQKSRVEPCRSEVTWNTAPDTIVSCAVATWICMADPLCSTALDYYNKNCQVMFKGGSCSRRCKNSLNILMKQVSARKLTNCFCDGTEEFKCSQIRENTDRLCFDKKKENEIEDNVVFDRSKVMTMKTDSLLTVISIMFSVLSTTLGESLRSFIEEIRWSLFKWQRILLQSILISCHSYSEKSIHIEFYNNIGWNCTEFMLLS